MTQKSQKAKYEILRSRDSATFDGTYQVLGPPLQHPPRLLKMQNKSDIDISISTNGVDEHDIILAGS